MLPPRVLLAPHLPTLLVDHRRGHHTPMLAAFHEAGEQLRAAKPKAVVVLSARWQSDGAFLVGENPSHTTITDYGGFGVEVRYDCAGHQKLARVLVDAGVRARLHVAANRRGLDSGVTVPMRFLVPAKDIPVVPLSLGAQPPDACRAWGRTLRQALAAWPDPVAFVVGGVFAFNRHEWEMGRDVPEATVFSAWAADVLARGAWPELASPDARLVRRAEPEAGLRHLELLHGFLDGDAAGDVRCYEAGPGVGSALIAFAVPGVDAPAEEAPADAKPEGAAAPPAPKPATWRPPTPKPATWKPAARKPAAKGSPAPRGGGKKRP